MAGHPVGAAHVSAAARFLHQEAMPLGSRYQGGAHAGDVVGPAQTAERWQSRQLMLFVSRVLSRNA